MRAGEGALAISSSVLLGAGGACVNFLPSLGGRKPRRGLLHDGWL